MPNTMLAALLVWVITVNQTTKMLFPRITADAAELNRIANSDLLRLIESVRWRTVVVP